MKLEDVLNSSMEDLLGDGENRTYHSYANEITNEALFEGLLGFGLFAEKIPPVVTAEIFYDWCTSQTDENIFKAKRLNRDGTIKIKSGKPCYFCASYDYIRYENMRNINIPRPLAIPHPIAYRNLCKTISDSWGELQTYIKDKTDGQEHKISRIHLRKLSGKHLLFEMNYKNFHLDAEPDADLSIGARVMVKADISNCFPSIYTHSIPWALVGKTAAKADRDTSKYFNKIDKFVRHVKYGETHGILIGPHASSLISEIILLSVDKVLYDKGYRYIRNIDDYTCWLENHEHAEQFLLDLSSVLKAFELTLNHKKTEILELPLASVEHWVRKMNTFYFHEKTIRGGPMLTLKEVNAYLDLAIELMQVNNNNSAILNYAIKVLSKKKLTKQAQKYFIKRVHHLILIYPYLILLLENHVFSPFSLKKKQVKEISDTTIDLAFKRNLWEAVSYALYYALKYDFELDMPSTLFDKAKESDDCIFLLLAYLYEKRRETSLTDFEDLAKGKLDDFDRYWLFVYEVLGETDLPEPFDTMKKDGVSFLKVSL